jgi:hypothetical protein
MSLRHPNEPWWARFIPDVRAWATVGMFGLAAYALTLVAMKPELADNRLFTTMATLLFGTGGLGLACSFLWGGSKTSMHAAETVTDAFRDKHQQPAEGGPAR